MVFGWCSNRCCWLWNLLLAAEIPVCKPFWNVFRYRNMKSCCPSRPSQIFICTTILPLLVTKSNLQETSHKDGINVCEASPLSCLSIQLGLPELNDISVISVTCGIMLFYQLDQCRLGLVYAFVSWKSSDTQFNYFNHLFVLFWACYLLVFFESSISCVERVCKQLICPDQITHDFIKPLSCSYTFLCWRVLLWLAICHADGLKSSL